MKRELCYLMENIIFFPRPMIDSKDLNFSFSGLKTAVLYKVKALSEKEDLSENTVNDIAFEFQNAQ